MHARAIAVMNARLYNESPAQRLTAIPSRGNPLHWRVIVAEGDGTVVIVPVNLNEVLRSVGRPHGSSARAPSAATDAAKATPPFQGFAAFCQIPFWKAAPVSGGTEVELIDLRFGSPQNPGFEAKALVDDSHQVHDAQVSFGAPPVRTP